MCAENQLLLTRMGWRYISYARGGSCLALHIEPMFTGRDVVFVPDNSNWTDSVPESFWEKRDEVVACLRETVWNRDLRWLECDFPCAARSKPDAPMPGTLESTEAGQALERLSLFDPGKELFLSPDAAKNEWQELERRFSAAARGRVSIPVSSIIGDSVFCKITLPTLVDNPNVQLEFMEAYLEKELRTSIRSKSALELFLRSMDIRFDIPYFAVFWSGPGNRKRAEDYAQREGRQTLGMFIDGQDPGLRAAIEALPYEDARPIWDYLSTKFADFSGQT